MSDRKAGDPITDPDDIAAFDTLAEPFHEHSWSVVVEWTEYDNDTRYVATDENGVRYTKDFNGRRATKVMCPGCLETKEVTV